MKFNFVKNRKYFFTFSIIGVIAALVLSFILPPNISIEFKGGTIITYSYENEVDQNAFKATVENIAGRATVSESNSLATGAKNLVVSLASNDGITLEKLNEITEAVEKDYGVKYVESSTVNPTIGKELLIKSLIAVALAAVLMIVYIGWRFRKIGGWSAGICSVIALLNDILVIYLTFVIFRFNFDTNFIAVVLTILGYSVNDTIVIYDRIRENRKTMGAEVPIGELVNTSLNQCLGRTFNTTLTTVSSLLVICVVALIFNVSSILTFAFPMMIGMIHGVYSSLCIAPQLWVLWCERKKSK